MIVHAHVCTLYMHALLVSVSWMIFCWNLRDCYENDCSDVPRSKDSSAKFCKVYMYNQIVLNKTLSCCLCKYSKKNS